MAKQKYEITAFTKGIIGSPSETDIPEDAASYSVNIDPNAEDGTLRSINKDSILDKSGFAQSSSDGIAQVTLQIKRSAAATDNGSSTYNYKICSSLSESYCAGFSNTFSSSCNQSSFVF